MAANAGGIEYSIDMKTNQLLTAEGQVNKFNKAAQAGFDKTDKEAKALTTTITSLAKTIGSVFAVQQFAGFVTTTSAAIDSQKKFADRIQISYEELQKLQFVAGQTGVGINNINTALQRMTRRLADVAQGGSPAVAAQLQKIGINIKDIQSLAPEKQFLAIADGFSTLTTEAEKTLAAFSFFDTEGVGLTNTLRLGSKGITDLGKTLEDVGGVISTKTAADFEAFNDKLDITSRAVEGLKVQFLAALLPALSSVGDAAMNIAKDGQAVANIITGIGVAAQATAVVLTAKLVAAFIKLIAEQAASTRQLIAASAAQVAYNRNLALGTTAIVAQSAALRGYNILLGALGGPAGLIFAVATSLLILAANSGKASESIEELNARTAELEKTFKDLKPDELDKKLEDTKKKIRETINEIERLQNVKPGDKGVIATLRRIDQLKNELTRLSEQQNIAIKIKYDIEQAPKREQAKLFETARVQANAFAKQAREAREELEKLSKLKIGDAGFVTAQDRIAELNTQIEKLDRAETILIEAAFNDGDIKLALSKLENTFADFKKTGITKLTVNDFIDLSESAAAAAMTPLEAINAEEKKQLKQLEALYKEFPQFTEQYEEAATNIAKAASRERTELINKEVKEKTDKYKSAQDKYLSAIKDANKAVMTEEQIAVFDAAEMLNEYDLLREKGYISSKQYADLEVALMAATNKKLDELRDKKLEKEVQALEELARKREEELKKQEEQANANKAFSDFASQQVDRTPMEEVAERERQAKEQLKTLYNESTMDIEEYNKAIVDIEKKYGKERDEVRKKQADANKAFQDFATQESITTPLEQIAMREAAAKDRLKELYDASTLDIEEFQAAVLGIEKKYAKERQDLALQEEQTRIAGYAAIAGATGDLFGNLAEVAEKTKGETSSAYKAMFAISKGFAIAQAGLNLSLALTNALASGPPPINFANVAAVAAAGAGLVSAVGSAVYSGRANGGPVSAGNMYKVNENGRPEVFSYGNSDYLMSGRNGSVSELGDMGGNGDIMVNIINQTSAPIGDVSARYVSRNEVEIIVREMIPAEISNPNSRTSKALASQTSSKRVLK